MVDGVSHNPRRLLPGDRPPRTIQAEAVQPGASHGILARLLHATRQFQQTPLGGAGSEAGEHRLRPSRDARVHPLPRWQARVSHRLSTRPEGLMITAPGTAFRWMSWRSPFLAVGSEQETSIQTPQRHPGGFVAQPQRFTGAPHLTSRYAVGVALDVRVPDGQPEPRIERTLQRIEGVLRTHDDQRRTAIPAQPEAAVGHGCEIGSPIACPQLIVQIPVSFKFFTTEAAAHRHRPTQQRCDSVIQLFRHRPPPLPPACPKSRCQPRGRLRHRHVQTTTTRSLHCPVNSNPELEEQLRQGFPLLVQQTRHPARPPPIKARLTANIRPLDSHPRQQDATSNQVRRHSPARWRDTGPFGQHGKPFLAPSQRRFRHRSHSTGQGDGQDLTGIPPRQS